MDYISRALAAPGTTTERVTRALLAKDLAIYDLVTGGPHAGELLAARDRVTREDYELSDRRILDLVSAALDDDVARGLAPRQLARIAVRASRGLAARAEARSTLAADITALVGRLLAPHAGD